MSSLPLTGRRVLVTRAAHQAGKLSEGLRALGAEPIEVPVLEIRPPDDLGPLDQSLRKLDQYDWLILTSANTVRALSQRALELGVGLDQPAGMKVAAIGDSTAAAARKTGFRVTFVPELYVAESLVAGLLEGVQFQTVGLRMLLVRGAGITVDVVDAYQNVLPEAAPEQLRQALAAGIDAATFTSSSSATHLAEAARAAGIGWPLAGVAAVSIGPITSETLRGLGWEPADEANPSDIHGLIDAVVRVLRS